MISPLPTLAYPRHGGGLAEGRSPDGGREAMLKELAERGIFARCAFGDPGTLTRRTIDLIPESLIELEAQPAPFPSGQAEEIALPEPDEALFRDEGVWGSASDGISLLGDRLIQGGDREVVADPPAGEGNRPPRGVWELTLVPSSGGGVPDPDLRASPREPWPERLGRYGAVAAGALLSASPFLLYYVWLMNALRLMSALEQAPSLA